MTDLKIEFTTEMATKYSSMIRRSIPGYEDMHQMVVSILLCRLLRAAKVLVVGAGEGQELVSLKKANATWRLTGVDPSADMLKVAREKLSVSGFNAELHAGETATLPAREPFDAATSILVMHFLKGEDNKLRFLRDIAARLNPGATYVLVELCGPNMGVEKDAMQTTWNRYQVCKGWSEDEVRENNERRRNSVFPIPASMAERLFAEADFIQPELFYRAFDFHGWVMVKDQK